MAQPLDIRVTFNAERGLTVAVEGVEENIAGMENSAVIWEVARYLVERLPDDGRMGVLRTIAIQMTEHFRRQYVLPVVERPIRRQRAEFFLQNQVVECDPPADDEEECCICLESGGEHWSRLQSCDHMFHTQCITEWVDPVCPMCMGDITRNVRRRQD